jgi:hypothetical protein
MKLLYDTITSALVAYPRDDDEPVIGLDPRYLEMTVIQDPQPSYDPATEQLTSTEAIDTEGQTVTRGWAISPLPAPEPVPDWATFKTALLSSPAANAALAAAMTSAPAAALALPAALIAAADGRGPSDFHACWDAQQQAELISEALQAEVVSAAEACNLPGEFVAALMPET